MKLTECTVEDFIYRKMLSAVVLFTLTLQVNYSFKSQLPSALITLPVENARTKMIILVKIIFSRYNIYYRYQTIYFHFVFQIQQTNAFNGKLNENRNSDFFHLNWFNTSS